MDDEQHIEEMGMKTTLRIAILGVSSVLALAACSGAKTQAVNTGTTAADW